MVRPGPAGGLTAKASPLFGGVKSAAALRRSEPAMTTAMMMAGDSIRAIAAAMWPPWGMLWVSRNCTAVTKVTALTEP